MSIIHIIAISLLQFVSGSSSSAPPSCVVNNAGRTPGECVHIRNCSYQIGRLRLGATVTNCGSWGGGKGDVCCPKEKSVSERQCLEWLEMLHAPASFDQPRLTTPLCPIRYGGWCWDRNAVHYEYPHSMALGYGPDGNNLTYRCGATLISPKFLLTAAHCLTDQTWGKPSHALVGEGFFEPQKTKAAYETESTGRIPIWRNLYIVKIANYFVHPEYKPPLIYNDIALVQLERVHGGDRHYLPACVGNPLTRPKGNSPVEASSWGMTDPASLSHTGNIGIPLAVNVTLVNEDTCNQTYGLGEGDQGLRYPRGIIISQLCAAEADGDSCRSEPGAGLLTREGACLFHVVGVTSIRPKGCGPEKPVLYTAVAAFQDWIESTVWGDGGEIVKYI